MYKNIKTEHRKDLLLVGLNRPNKRNAINDSTIHELDQVFSVIDKEVKCVVIYGVGDHFSAGLDLSELTERNTLQGLHHSRMWHNTMDKIQYAPVPVVCSIHGACVGGGLELASACHIRVADASAFFSLPEGSRGIFVGGGGSVRVTKLIGIANMTDMMLTGRVYDAQNGYRLGLTQYLVEQGNALAESLLLAEKIGGNTPMTNLALTHILPRIVDSNQDVGLMMEAMAAAIAQSTPEAKQRMTDFLEGKAKKVGE